MFNYAHNRLRENEATDYFLFTTLIVSLSSQALDPVKLTFDNDIANDCDDVRALIVLKAHCNETSEICLLGDFIESF